MKTNSNKKQNVYHQITLVYLKLVPAAAYKMQHTLIDLYQYKAVRIVG